MDKLEVKVVVESRFKELGANKLSLQPSGDCWTLNGEFFSVCLLKDFWVIEWTGNYSYALGNCYEDTDIMPYKMSREEIIQYIDEMLLR